MYDATVIVVTPDGERTYSQQLVRPIYAETGRFSWHAGDVESLMRSIRVRLLRADGSVIGEGRIASDSRPTVRGDYRVEFKLTDS
jgi:hypothetical protein